MNLSGFIPSGNCAHRAPPPTSSFCENHDEALISPSTMKFHCPHCQHEQEIAETAINRVLDCPSCQRRFVAKRPAPPPAPKSSLGCLLVPLLALLVAGGALGYVCWRQQVTPLALARQLRQNYFPDSAPAAPSTPPPESVRKDEPPQNELPPVLPAAPPPETDQPAP